MWTKTVLPSERTGKEGPGRAVGAGVALAVWRHAILDKGEDPRLAELRRAVARMRRELAGYPVELSDRAAADDELVTLDAMVSAGLPEVPQLRHSLLLIAGAVGSVSALSGSLAEVRDAIELFGEPPTSGDRSLW